MADFIYICIITPCLSLHPPVDIYDASMLDYSRWCCCEHGGTDLFSKFAFVFPLDVLPEAELLNHMVVLFLIFWGSASLDFESQLPAL